ncbi:hypothetical protein HPB49_003172 [Dermacentor silvarum]|uniref:Uncharacterized protein n=1 Tax=Dermacentor silvarum TaxID=543639 RepID=A0ACB8DT74_DERSI|nr:hypothetical protein HPB49_003172 [Dermacentor silvarum]
MVLKDLMLSGVLHVPPEVTDCLCARSSADKVKVALSSMKRGSAPEPDRLPIDLYLTFWEDIGTTFVSVIHYCFENFEFPASFCDGGIVLIPKHDPSSVCPEE